MGSEFIKGLAVASAIWATFMWLTGEFVGAIPFEQFQKCARGQDMSLRESVGTAIFEVKFKDGGYYSHICTPNPPTAD